MGIHADSLSELGSLTLEWGRERRDREARLSRRASRILATVAFVASDLLAIGAAAFIAAMAVQWGGFIAAQTDVRIVAVLALLALAPLAIFRTYQVIGLGPHEELRGLVLAISSLFIPLSVIAIALVQAAVISVLAWWVLSVFFLFVARTLARRLLSRWDQWGEAALLVSDDGFGLLAVDLLERARRRGYRPEALYNLSPSGTPGSHEEAPAAEVVILVFPNSEPAAIESLADRYFGQVPAVLSLPAISSNSELWLEPVRGLVAARFEGRKNLLEVSSQIVKRAFDLATSLALMLLLLPMFIVIAIVVRLDSKGPIFYSQRRIGQSGKSFEMLKFRTMQPDAEARLAAHLKTDAALRREWELYQKLAEDPRTTSAGGVLRKWSLDELPQILNVIRGDMSLVGPRPMFAGQEPHYGKELYLYNRVRPGLTGLWQISGRNRITFRDRAWLDGFYVRNWSIWLDFYILAKTPLAIFRGEGTPNGSA